MNIIEVVLGQPLIQSRVEWVTGGRRKIRRRHPDFRLPLADASSHGHVQSVVHENDAAAEDAARLLKERGAAPLVIKADIGKVADIQRMFETIKSQFGGLDIFVSNARATLATGFYAG